MAALSEVKMKMIHMSAALAQLPRKHSFSVSTAAILNQTNGNSRKITAPFLYVTGLDFRSTVADGFWYKKMQRNWETNTRMPKYNLMWKQMFVIYL